MPGVFEHLKPGVGDALREVFMVGDGRDRIALTSQNQRRAADPRKLRREVVGERFLTEEVVSNLWSHTHAAKHLWGDRRQVIERKAGGQKRGVMLLVWIAEERLRNLSRGLPA